MNVSRTILLAGAVLTLGIPVRAEVVSADAVSASIRIVAPVSVAPDKAYAAFLQIDRWWNKEHTFSGDSANLKLNPVAGGCFCESLPGGGSVLHGTVVFVMPQKRITLNGGLGPLQTAGLAAALTFSFVARKDGSEIVLLYNIGGFYPKGLSSVVPDVNEVLQGQMDRLQRFADTGNAEGPPAASPKP